MQRPRAADIKALYELSQLPLIPVTSSALQIWVYSVSNVRIHTEDTQLFLRSKYLIIRSKCFHKRFLLITIGNIYPENGPA
jgi:hypothetical protein